MGTINKSKHHHGPCPEVGKFATIEIVYMSVAPQNEEFIKVRNGCWYLNENKCSFYRDAPKECPIYEDAPNTIDKDGEEIMT